MSESDRWLQAYEEEVKAHDVTRKHAMSLAERVHAQAALLSRRAERPEDSGRLTAAYHDLCAVLGWAVDDKPATAEMVARAAKAIVKRIDDLGKAHAELSAGPLG